MPMASASLMARPQKNSSWLNRRADVCTLRRALKSAPSVLMISPLPGLPSTITRSQGTSTSSKTAMQSISSKRLESGWSKRDRGSGEIINTLGADFNALLNVQTSARLLSQLEFFCGLAMRLADAIGITGFLHVQEKLGEMLSQMEIARAVFYGAEAMAQRLDNRVWVPGGHGLRAFHLQSGKIYSRFVEIVQTLAAA